MCAPKGKLLITNLGVTCQPSLIVLNLVTVTQKCHSTSDNPVINKGFNLYFLSLIVMLLVPNAPHT
jgi:hypothetical protein